MIGTDPSLHVRFVLSHTSHPGNIGSSARAMRTMGFKRLNLVAPEAFPHCEATALAAGAGDVLDAAVVHTTLTEALSGCRLVLGATARRRGVTLEELDPRTAAQRVLAAAGAGHEVALLFGNERAGLANDEIMHCHAAITIPTDAQYSSLNLSQAVQIVAWELRMATLAAGVGDRVEPARSAERTEPPASAEEMEGFFEHLGRTLDEIEFHKGRSPRTIMRRLRKLFLRAQPDQRELRVLRGIFADATRMARIARTRDES
jgi:tRNA (cytidine32/uridine32-2'-O)-methyltransferase